MSKEKSDGVTFEQKRKEREIFEKIIAAFEKTKDLLSRLSEVEKRLDANHRLRIDSESLVSEERGLAGAIHGIFLQILPELTTFGLSQRIDFSHVKKLLESVYTNKKIVSQIHHEVRHIGQYQQAVENFHTQMDATERLRLLNDAQQEFLNSCSLEKQEETIGHAGNLRSQLQSARERTTLEVKPAPSNQPGGSVIKEKTTSLEEYAGKIYELDAFLSFSLPAKAREEPEKSQVKKLVEVPLSRLVFKIQQLIKEQEKKLEHLKKKRSIFKKIFFRDTLEIVGQKRLLEGLRDGIKKTQELLSNLPSTNIDQTVGSLAAQVKK